MTEQFYYRYETFVTVPMPDRESGYSSSSIIFQTVQVILMTFLVEKETPKGKWIVESNWKHNRRFVLNESQKKYAYPTKEGAMLNFTKRTALRKKFLENQASVCVTALRIAKEIKLD